VQTLVLSGAHYALSAVDAVLRWHRGANQLSRALHLLAPFVWALSLYVCGAYYLVVLPHARPAALLREVRLERLPRRSHR